MPADRITLPSPDEAVGVVRDLVDGFHVGDVELIDDRHADSRVYCARSGDRERPVMAKWCNSEAARRESLVYGVILPGSAVNLLRFHGTAPAESPGQAWIVMDAALGDRFDSTRADHRAAVGGWLGHVHLHSEASPALALLPDHGAAHRLAIAATAHETLQAALDNPVLTAEQRTVVEQMDAMSLAFSRRLREGLWESLGVVGECLEHGDLVAKNVRVPAHGSRLDVEVFDWGAAGRSLPTTDLAIVDLDAYLAVIRSRWPSIDRDALTRMAAIGAVSRILFVIAGEAASLASPWPTRSVARVRAYLDRLQHQSVAAALSGAAPRLVLR